MEFIANMLGSGASIVVVVFLAILILFYVLSIAFVIKDAHSRSSNWYLWAIISIVPFIGFIIYLIMRPPLTEDDRDEQELELALKRRQLLQYGNCSHCGYPIEADYVLCPHCHQRLKNLCPTCRHALNPEWAICPYCATTIHSGNVSARPQNTGTMRRQSNRPSVSGATGAHQRVH